MTASEAIGHATRRFRSSGIAAPTATTAGIIHVQYSQPPAITVCGARS